jgi:hypothetical protein
MQKIFGGAIAVRHVRLIGEEQQVMLRQQFTNAAQDGEAAQAGVKESEHLLSAGG